MQIRIRETQQVMYENEFRTLFPNTSLPQQLTENIINELGGDVVFEGSQVELTRYQISFYDGVELIEGKWYTKYSVADMSADTKTVKDIEQAKYARFTRDTLLAKTDWRFRSDMTPSQAWKDYCQALRDVPTQQGFPWDIIWPTQPE
jgi:hypothetical protein